MSAEREAYRFAQGLITVATVTRSHSLSFARKETLALVQLPPEIRFLNGLRELDLSSTQLTDISVVGELTGLTSVTLTNTRFRDLSPMAKLTTLTTLMLGNTLVSGLSHLEKLTGLTTLRLDNTPALDLRVLRNLKQLTDTRVTSVGLSFKGTAATRADPRIAKIAEIDNSAERAMRLFEHLDGWEPPGKHVNVDANLTMRE